MFHHSFTEGFLDRLLTRYFPILFITILCSVSIKFSKTSFIVLHFITFNALTLILCASIFLFAVFQKTSSLLTCYIHGILNILAYKSIKFSVFMKVVILLLFGYTRFLQSSLCRTKCSCFLIIGLDLGRQLSLFQYYITFRRHIIQLSAITLHR